MPDYALMNQCLYEGKAREGEQMTRDALAGGRSAQEILRDGLIAGMSALLTTTMTYMKVVIDGFQQQGQGHIKMAIGGAPISQMFADEVGADGYGADASAAVDLFLYLVGKGAAPAAAKPGAAPIPSTSAPRGPRPANSTVKYQVLYWQDIPAQVKAWDGFEEAKVDLAPRFAARIDRAAQKQGLTKSDDYLAQWRWGDEAERPGAAAEVADAVRAEIEAAVP
jgi:hypothetical protein